MILSELEQEIRKIDKDSYIRESGFAKYTHVVESFRFGVIALFNINKRIGQENAFKFIDTNKDLGFYLDRPLYDEDIEIIQDILTRKKIGGLVIEFLKTPPGERMMETYKVELTKSEILSIIYQSFKKSENNLMWSPETMSIEKCDKYLVSAAKKLRKVI